MFQETDRGKPIDTRDTYDLRSEIAAKGHKYYIQTNLVPSQRAIIVSLFHEGTLLSKRVEQYDAHLSSEEVRYRAKEFHAEKTSRINSLLSIKDKLVKMDDGKAHLKLSEALFRQNLFRESMAEVVRAVKLGVHDSKAFSILGNSLAALGDHEKAVKSFNKGLELSPDYPDLHNDLGRALINLKRCAEAARAFERAVELNKYYQDAYMNLAIALCLNVVEKDDFEMSRGVGHRLREILAKTLQLKPSFDTDEYRQAVAAVEDERYDIAYERLSKIQNEGLKVADNHLSLDLYLILKFNSENLSEEDIDRYIDRTRRALEANPGYADLQNDLGVLYTAKCKLYIDKARGAFHTSLKINRNFKKAGKNLKLTENDGQGIELLLRALLD
jgi:Flp pilus assembly protein TadD